MSPTLRLDQPATYEIQVFGRLAERWSDFFGDFTLTVQSDQGEAITILRGIVADQAALHGALNHIRDLGLPLISVQFIQNPQGE